MNQFRKGILGLGLFNPETNKWGQAHTQGAYVFTQYLYKNQTTKFLKFEFDEENQEFYIHLDKDRLNKEGRELIRNFLIILQTYKSSGAVDIAAKWYNKYSEVDEFFRKVRTLVVSKKKARRIELNNNLFRYNEKNITPQVYPECFEGVIKSFDDRFEPNEALANQIISEWDKTAEHLRVMPGEKL